MNVLLLVLIPEHVERNGIFQHFLRLVLDDGYPCWGYIPAPPGVSGGCRGHQGNGQDDVKMTGTHDLDVIMGPPGTLGDAPCTVRETPTWRPSQAL